MPHTTPAGTLLIAGGAIIGTLGLAHAAFTLMDIRRPRRIVPDDPAVITAMERSTVRLSRGASTMWAAWIGFNLSHSLGALLFAGGAIALGVLLPGSAVPRSLLLLPVAVGATYLWIAVKYWFRTPLLGIGAATACFLLAWFLY